MIISIPQCLNKKEHELQLLNSYKKLLVTTEIHRTLKDKLHSWF